MLLAVGVLAALLDARNSGKGQVVDAAMTDGVSLLSSIFYGLHADKRWTDERGSNLLDGGAFYYGTYECADGGYVAIGAIEPQFYAELRKLCGLSDPIFDNPANKSIWPEAKNKLAEVFRTRTRDEWCALLEGTDACFAPVLDWTEAPHHHHHHNAARQTFISNGGVIQPAPAPRFSRTVNAVPVMVHRTSVKQVISDWSSEAV